MTAIAGAVKRVRKRQETQKRVPGALAVGCATGMAGAYFLDPQNGKRRRHIARDRALALVRRRGAEARRRAEYMKGQAVGVAHSASRGGEPQGPAANDQALEDRVRNEIFRPADAPKGSVNVNVENGVVFLRGQVEDPEGIEKLVDAACAVPGVREVENLLHTPGTPARAKGGGTRVPAGSAA